MEKLSIAAIEQGFNSLDNTARIETLQKCLNREYDYIPLDIIKRWSKSENCRLRFMAMYDCLGRYDIPSDTILAGVNDEDEWVQLAALEALEALEA